LIIELNGSQHFEQVAHDEERTKWLNEHRFQVLRFWNNDVLLGIDGVIEQIRNHILNDPHPALRADLSQ
jgi:very-short-patch-repair endonuclease